VDDDPGADDPCKECECQSFDGVYGWSCLVQVCDECPDEYNFTDDGTCCGICECPPEDGEFCQVVWVLGMCVCVCARDLCVFCP
jgi:hypothetical protein